MEVTMRRTKYIKCKCTSKEHKLLAHLDPRRITMLSRDAKLELLCEKIRKEVRQEIATTASIYKNCISSAGQLYSVKYLAVLCFIHCLVSDSVCFVHYCNEQHEDGYIYTDVALNYHLSDDFNWVRRFVDYVSKKQLTFNCLDLTVEDFNLI